MKTTPNDNGKQGKRTLMKKILLIMGSLLACALNLHAGYVNGPLLFEADFSSPEALTKWSNFNAATLLQKGGPEGGPALQFTTSKPGDKMIYLPLDASKINGLLRVEAVVRGEGLELPEKAHWGSKIMLNYHDGSRMHYDEPMRTYGSFGWKTISMIVDVPDKSKNMTLTLGLQGCVGSYYVSSVKICRAVETDDSSAKPPVNKEAAAIPHGDFKGGKFRGVMSGNGLEEKDFATLKDWGANLMRYQLWTRGADISTPEKYLAWIDSEIERLDKILPIANRNGVKIAIDLHVGPGTKISEVASNILVDGNLALETLVQAWQKLATHYKGNTSIYGYDLLNEPVVDGYIKGNENANAWQHIAERLVQEIRQIDPETPIIVEPDSNFENVKLIDAKNIIYSPHYYSPHEYTHQLVLSPVRWSYPGEINGVYWDKEQMRVFLKPVIEFQRKHNARIFIGEFSTAYWAKGGDRYLADCIALFEEYGWDWTYHAFREAPAWSVEYEGASRQEMKPSADNPRKRVLLEALKKNAQ